MFAQNIDYSDYFRQVHLTSETLEYNLFLQKCARETVMMSGHWFPPHSPSQHSSIHCQMLFEELLYSFSYFSHF